MAELMVFREAPAKRDLEKSRSGIDFPALAVKCPALTAVAAVGAPAFALEKAARRIELKNPERTHVAVGRSTCSQVDPPAPDGDRVLACSGHRKGLGDPACVGLANPVKGSRAGSSAKSLMETDTSPERGLPVLATSKSGTQWEPRDQGLDGGLVSSLRALL